MKNQLFGFIVLMLLALVACAPPVAVEETEAPDYAAFDERVEVVRSFIQAHCDEDLNAQSAILSDTLQWSPPQFNGNVWLGKADYVAALQNYHNEFEGITYTEGIVMADTLANGMWSGSIFPEGTASNSPTAIRQYGTWTATHTESGKEVGVKWFGLSFINDAGKIVRISEYFDVHGLAAQIAAE